MTKAWPALACAAAFLVAAGILVGSRTLAQEPRLTGDLPYGGGTSLVVWDGGTADDLLSEASALGCNVRSVFANRPGGGFVGYFPTTLTLPNQDFLSVYPGGVLPSIAVIVICNPGGSTPSETPTAVCDEPVPADLLDILDRRIGYGRNATGGADGCLYRVTTDAASGPGSLREGAERGDAWVVFDGDYDITVPPGVNIAPNTTIDGRGHDITIRGDVLGLQIHRTNVIVTSITIDNVDGRSVLDGIEISGPRATDIWIDHVSFRVTPDELLALYSSEASGNAAGNVTVTWSRFGEGGLSPASTQAGSHGILIADQLQDGASAASTHVTLAYNYFVTHSRAPRVDDGARVHSFNNLYKRWVYSGINPARNGQARSENNIFAESGGNRTGAYFYDESAQFPDGVMYDAGSWFPNGASGTEINRDDIFTPPYSYQLLPADQSLADLIESSSGPIR